MVNSRFNARNRSTAVRGSGTVWALLVECVGGQSRERAHADEPTAEAVFRGILLSPFQSLLLRELLLLLPLLYGEFLPQAV